MLHRLDAVAPQSQIGESSVDSQWIGWLAPPLCIVGGGNLNRETVRSSVALNGDATVDAPGLQTLENEIRSLFAYELELRQMLREELDDWALGVHEGRSRPNI